MKNLQDLIRENVEGTFRINYSECICSVQQHQSKITIDNTIAILFDEIEVTVCYIDSNNHYNQIFTVNKEVFLSVKYDDIYNKETFFDIELKKIYDRGEKLKTKRAISFDLLSKEFGDLARRQDAVREVVLLLRR